MDYDEEDGGTFGNIPEYGAIFMSNTETKKECLTRKIFALPYSQAGFVSHIKAGMALFLFEFKKRQLFGVFQATCDGALDILPHAFNYSGKRFPAQVHFRQLWHCHPLSEREFRDAIRENYFSANQFNFGLSVDQVQRLLYLFSSRKMENKIPRNPRSEAIVEVAVKDRRWVGGDRHELIERGDMGAAEYDGINNVAFSDHQVSSLAGGREDGVLVDSPANAEGKVYPFPQNDFLCKKRRIGSRLTTNNATENGLYSPSYLRTFCSDSPNDSLGLVRRLAISGRSDELDVRVQDDYPLKRKSTSPDDYNTHDGHQRAFASDHCGGSLQRNHVINDGKFNAVKSRASDDILNLDRQSRDIAEDHEWLINRKLETRRHLDCDDDITSAFGHSLRKTASGRLLIDEDRNYPTVEKRSTESMVENFPPVPATTAGYIANVDRQTVDQRFRKIQRLDTNDETSHRPTNPVLSVKYPSFSQVDQNLSSFSNNLFPEEQFSQVTRSHNFDLSCSTFDDATIIRALPYDQPNLSTSMQKNHRHGGSLGNFYAPSSHRVQQYTLESEESRRPVDMALEFENNGFLRSSSGLQSSLLRESINSFVDPNSFVDMDLDTSAPVHYRGSSSSKLSPPCTDHENFGGEKGLLAYYSKSRDSCLTFHGNLREASEDLGAEICQPKTGAAIYENQHYRVKELHKTSEANSTLSRKSVFTRLSSKESTWLGEESNDIDVDHQDCYMDAAADEIMLMLKQNDNLSLRKLKKSRVVGQPRENAVDEKKIQRSMETDHSRMERRRLKFASQTTSPRENAVDEKKIQSNMGTDQSTMENRRLKFCLSTSARENAVGKKKIQFGLETDHSTMEKKRLKFASETTEDSMDKIPNETRTLDFKRRSDRKRNLVGTGTGLASHCKLSGANEEAKSSMGSTLRRRKLVRPVFIKTDSAVDATCGALVMPALNLDKDDKQCCKTAISSHESEIPIIASHTCQEIDSNKELPYPEEQEDEVAHVLPSTNPDLKGHGQVNHDLPISKVLKETSQQKSLDVQTSGESILAEDTAAATRETSQQKSLDIQTSVEVVLAEVTGTTITETSELKSLDVQTSGESILAGDTDTAIKEKSQQKSFNIQTSVESVLAEVTDTTFTETSQQNSFDIETSGECILADEDTDSAIEKTSQRKGLDIQTSVEGVLAEVTDTTITETSQLKSLDIRTSGECILAENMHSAIKETSEQKSSNIQTSLEGVLAEVTDTTITQTSQQNSLDIQTSGECILAENTHSAMKETTEQKSCNIQTSLEGVFAEFADTVVKETSQQKSLDIEKSGEGVLSEVTDTAIKETSQQKSLDIQTFVEGLSPKFADTTTKDKSQPKSLDVQTSTVTTITNLNLPESSMEGFKLGAGCVNILTGEKHLKKMKIILTSKRDAKASSQ